MENKVIVRILCCLLMLPSASLLATRRSAQSSARTMRRERYSRGGSVRGARGSVSSGRTSSRGSRYNLVRGRGNFQSGARRLPMGGRFAQRGRISRGRDRRSAYADRGRGRESRMRSRSDRYAGRGRASRTRGPVQQEYYDEYTDEESVDQLPEEGTPEAEITEETKEKEGAETDEAEEVKQDEKKEESASWDKQFSTKELHTAVVELQKKKEKFRRDKQMDGFATTVAPERYDSLIKGSLPAESFGNATTISLIELHRKINDYLAAPGLPKGGMNTITFKENEPHLLTQDGKKVIATSFELYNDYEQQLKRVRPTELQKRKELFEQVLAKLSESDKKKVIDPLNATVKLLDQKKAHLAKLSLSVTTEMKTMSIEDLSKYIIKQMSERKEAVLEGWAEGLSGGHFWGTIHQSYAHPFGERNMMLERSCHEFYFACMSNGTITADEKAALLGALGDPFDYEFVDAIRPSA